MTVALTVQKPRTGTEDRVEGKLSAGRQIEPNWCKGGIYCSVRKTGRANYCSNACKTGS